MWSPKAQYTPQTPTRLNCRVESRRLCVRNSQLHVVGDSLDESEQICQQRSRVRCVVLVWTHPSAVVTQFYNFLCCWAIEVGDKWRHNYVIAEKVINIDQNLRSKTAMQSVWSVSKLSTKSVGSRRELVANSVHTADADATQLDS